MSNPIGGPGARRVGGGGEVERVDDTGGAQAAPEAGGPSGAPGAKRTPRARSLDAKGIGLAAELEARLAAATGAGAAGPAADLRDALARKDDEEATGIALKLALAVSGTPPDAKALNDALAGLAADGKLKALAGAMSRHSPAARNEVSARAFFCASETRTAWREATAEADRAIEEAKRVATGGRTPVEGIRDALARKDDGAATDIVWKLTAGIRDAATAKPRNDLILRLAADGKLTELAAAITRQSPFVRGQLDQMGIGTPEAKAAWQRAAAEVDRAIEAKRAAAGPPPKAIRDALGRKDDREANRVMFGLTDINRLSADGSTWKADPGRVKELNDTVVGLAAEGKLTGLVQAMMRNRKSWLSQVHEPGKEYAEQDFMRIENQQSIHKVGTMMMYCKPAAKAAWERATAEAGYAP